MKNNTLNTEEQDVETAIEAAQAKKSRARNA
jgi:hypothetical protein